MGPKLPYLCFVISYQPRLQSIPGGPHQQCIMLGPSSRTLFTPSPSFLFPSKDTQPFDDVNLGDNKRAKKCVFAAGPCAPLFFLFSPPPIHVPKPQFSPKPCPEVFGSANCDVNFEVRPREILCCLLPCFPFSCNSNLRCRALRLG